MKHTKNKGFTLVEVMVTVAIVAILLGVSAPSFSRFLIDMRVDNHISELHRLILTARNTSINTNEIVILCPLGNTGECTNDWNDELTVFTDNNDNGKFDGTDEVVKVKDQLNNDDKTYFTGDTIAYKPTGRSNNNSSEQLSYCPSQIEKLARGIEISPTGRSYVSHYIADDSYQQYRTGSSVACN